jgi:hypothetical protein
MEELKTMVSAEFLEIATEVKNVVDRAYAIRERQTYAILFQVNKGKFVDDGEMGYRLRGSILTVAEKPLWDKFIASLSSPLEEGKELPSDEEIWKCLCELESVPMYAIANGETFYELFQRNRQQKFDILAKWLRSRANSGDANKQSEEL